MKKILKIIIIGIILIISSVAVLGSYKFNYLANKQGYDVDGNKIKDEKIQEEKNELHILVAGDIMLDRHIRKEINKYENDSTVKAGEGFVNNFLMNLREVNSQYDYVMANLEGPITENKSKTLRADGTYSKDLIFTFPTSSVQILKFLNIKMVSLANNHTDNFYRKGYEDTKKFLESGDIKYFGNPYNEKQNLSQEICEKDICVTYIGYHQFTKNNSGALISDEIKRVRDETDFIIIMPHWGTEYAKISNQKQKDLAHSWIDAGADMVIGAHPHVVEESEIYKDKHIYYSLGNYIFDQWFSDEVKSGLALDILFSKTCKDICEKNIQINKSLKVEMGRDLIKYGFVL